MDTSASDNPILLKRRPVSENSSAPNSDLYGSSVPRRQSVGVAKPNPARCHGFWVSLLVCGNFSIFLVCSKGYFSENSTDHDKLFYEYILIALMPLVFLNMMACMALRPKDAITHWWVYFCSALLAEPILLCGFILMIFWLFFSAGPLLSLPSSRQQQGHTFVQQKLRGLSRRHFLQMRPFALLQWRSKEFATLR